MKRLFIICQCLGILAYSFIDDTTIPQGRSTPLVIVQMTKAGEGLIKMAQRLVVLSVTATDLSQHHLHPSLTIWIFHHTKEMQGVLGTDACLLEIPLFETEHG